MKECCLDGKVFVHSQALNCFRKSIGILPNGAPIDTSKKSGGERNSWNENIGGTRGFRLSLMLITTRATGPQQEISFEIDIMIHLRRWLIVILMWIGMRM